MVDASMAKLDSAKQCVSKIHGHIYSAHNGYQVLIIMTYMYLFLCALSCGCSDGEGSDEVEWHPVNAVTDV